jgi:uncharacterized protein YkwD
MENLNSSPVALVLSVALALVLGGCGGGAGGGDQSGSDLAIARSASQADTSTSTSVAGINASADSAALSCDLNQPAGIQQEMLMRVNQVRNSGAMCGNSSYPSSAPLQWNNELLQAAAGHSADMSTRNYFSHISLDGRTPPQRLKQAGYDYSSMGENIAAGQASVEAVVAAWVASPDHCKNLMNPVFRDIGVACIANAGTTFGRYWTMELGREF